MPGRLVGRETEQTALADRLADLAGGRGTAIVLDGPPGIGKSRLLDEAGRIAERLEVAVVRGRAQEGDRLLPFGPFTTALGTRAVGVEDVAHALERHVLHHGPTVVLLDDLQWADAGTYAALRALPEALATAPVGWVLAVRGHEAPAELQALLRTTPTLSLGELPRDTAVAVVADALGAPPDPRLLALVDRAGGNPFLLAELVTGLQEEDLVRVADGRALLTDVRLPRRLGDTMRDRLRRLTPAARQAVTVASLLGRDLTFDGLAVALDRPATDLLVPVEELVEHAFLEASDDGVAFRHDLVREGVRATIADPVRRALERQVARALLRAGRPPVDVAHQLSTSAEHGDTEAIATLAAAARGLAGSDAAAAADLARRAFELCRPEDPTRPGLAAEAVVLLHAAGRVAEGQVFAAEVLREVLPVEDEATVCLSLAGLLTLSPDVRAAMGDRALALDGLSPALRARHLAALSHNRLAAGRTALARAARADAAPAVAAHGDATARFTYALSSAALAYVDGDVPQALTTLEDAMRVRGEVADDARRRMTAQWRAELLLALDRIDEALDITAAALGAAQRDRQPWAVRWFESSRGRYLLHPGRLEDAAAALEPLLTVPPDPAGRSVVDVAGIAALGQVAVHRGDARLAAATAAVAREALATGVPGLRRMAAWLLARVRLAAGDAAGAHAELTALGPDLDETPLPLYPLDIADPPQLVRLARAAGDDDLAARAVAQAAARHDAAPEVASVAGAALHARGLRDGDADALAAAVDRLARGPRPLLLASAAEDLGVLLAGGGDRDGAVARLGLALETWAACGATWDARRVRGRLRALGVRRRLPAAARATTGWDALTPSELAVVRLVAEGLTNREVAERLFVSPHTVSMHLRHAFTKLGVSSRVELARLVVAGETTTAA